jgi:nitrite reductase (NADH) small subunit
MARWSPVCELKDIPISGSRVVQTEGGPVAVFRAHDDALFALSDNCPHRQAPLSEGVVHDHQVTCPLHNWVIDLGTGNALAPDRGRVACYAVKLIDQKIWLQTGAD